jgi:GNAT superfamily N-acetyltransferase
MKTKSKILFRSLNKEYVLGNINLFILLIKNWEYGDWKEKNFLIDLQNKWNYSLGIFDNKSLIGFCFASEKITNLYYIHLLYLNNEYRSKGIATSLLKSIEKF